MWSWDSDKLWGYVAKTSGQFPAAMATAGHFLLLEGVSYFGLPWPPLHLTSQILAGISSSSQPANIQGFGFRPTLFFIDTLTM